MLCPLALIRYALLIATVIGGCMAEKELFKVVFEPAVQGPLVTITSVSAHYHGWHCSGSTSHTDYELETLEEDNTFLFRKDPYCVFSIFMGFLVKGDTDMCFGMRESDLESVQPDSAGYKVIAIRYNVERHSVAACKQRWLEGRSKVVLCYKGCKDLLDV